LTETSLTCAVFVCSLGLAAPLSAQTPPEALPPPTTAESNAFSRLFKPTINDFRQLPSKDTLLWLVIGGTAAATGHSHDWTISNGLAGVRSMHDVFRPGSTIGGARAQMAGAIATFCRVAGRVFATSRRIVHAAGSQLDLKRPAAEPSGCASNLARVPGK
jgi:hypothetical protein